MDPVKLRAWWSFRQGLDGSLEGKSPAAVLSRSGWARSVGGVGPYLTLHARTGASREAVDKAVAELEIHELPSARGCTYVLPAEDFALGLRVSQEFGKTELKTAAKLGVSEREIDKLCQAVLGALASEPLEPDAIRSKVGAAARSLGEEGKRKGISTTVPLALGRLQGQGAIRRIPVDGRLDQQRYRYTVWKPNPLAKLKLSEEEAHKELARRFFKWTGAATLPEFQWFSGLGVKVSRAAVESLQLVPIEPESPYLLLPEDVDEFKAFETKSKPHYVLTSSLDAIHALRRDVKGLLDQADWERPFLVDKGTQTGATMSDLPHHVILDRGRIVGMWEYDPEAKAIVHSSFVGAEKALEAAVKATESYIRDQLGDARSFSLDSPKSRAPRIESLKTAK